MSDNPIRIVVVDDADPIRTSVVELLNDADDFDVVGEASNGRDGLDVVRGTMPDVVLMDLRMPVMNGVEATRTLTEDGVDIPVILHTAYSDDSLVLEGLKAGARGYLLKGSAGADLLSTIRSVVAGNSHVSDEVTGPVVEKLVAALDAERKTRVAAEKAAHELEIINERQREFAMMSQHELRTPLTVLLVALESLIDTDNEDERRALELFALSGGRRLRRLTENLEVAASPRALTATKTVIDVRAVIDDAIEDLEASQTVTCDVPSGFEVTADELRLRQLFGNIIENAVEKSGGQPVEISAHPSDGSLTITIADNGPGFVKAPTFDDASSDGCVPFALRRDAARGFGLGLWVAHQLVTAIGGSIRAANKTTERGAIVSVRLPLAYEERLAS